MGFYIRSFRILILVFWSFSSVKAQDSSIPTNQELDFAEFNKRAVLPVEGGMGFSSQQSKALFSIQISPQITVIKHFLRLGVTAGGAYTTSDQLAEKWSGYVGPKVSYKLKSLAAKLNGLPDGIAYGNINVFFEHLWGGNNIKLYGGGLAIELLKKATVSLKVHRDYTHQSTWGQLGISYNFIPQKKEITFQNSH